MTRGAALSVRGGVAGVRAERGAGRGAGPLRARRAERVRAERRAGVGPGEREGKGLGSLGRAGE